MHEYDVNERKEEPASLPPIQNKTSEKVTNSQDKPQQQEDQSKQQQQDQQESPENKSQLLLQDQPNQQQEKQDSYSESSQALQDQPDQLQTILLDGIQLTATIDSQDSGTIVAGTTAIDYFSCIPSRPLQKYFTELTK